MLDTNSDLQQRVGVALAEDERTRDLQIEVSDSNGVIELRGHVPSEEDRRAAEAVAERQSGVVKVINNLQVLEEGEPVADADEDHPALYRDDVPPIFPNKSG